MELISHSPGKSEMKLAVTLLPGTLWEGLHMPMLEARLVLFSNKKSTWQVNFAFLGKYIYYINIYLKIYMHLTFVKGIIKDVHDTFNKI